MKAVGLYDPAYEHDSCGVAFVARLDGVASHEALVRAATALGNLEHRGAEGADALTGDGAGMTLQLPDALFRAEIGAALPPLGSYGVAVCFLPREAERAAALEEEGFDDLGSGRLVEGFARHFMVVLDAWKESSFAAVAKSYLQWLPPESGLRRNIDDNGDLLLRRTGPAASPAVRSLEMRRSVFTP